MSAAAQTKIFGLKIGLDPKILVGGLVLIAVLLFWYNSRSSDEGSNTPSAARSQVAPPQPVAQTSKKSVVRRNTRSADNQVLRMKPVDPTHGDIDPTLRLDLLSRVQTVPPATGVRNLFDLAATPVVASAALKQIHGPPIVPKPLPVPMPGGPLVPAVNIPLKFYGYMKPGKGKNASGLFLDGDNIIVATEGEVVKSRYLVVELTPNSARLEDTQLKQGQTLPVVPEARTDN